MQAYKDMKPYFGDLHSHCSVGYGHGSLDEAFSNAKMQLDFAALTVHGHWPEIPDQEPRLKELAEYHRRGFHNSSSAWSEVQDAVETYRKPGEFITFLGYEWHSNHSGDHNIYFNGPKGEIIRAASLDELRQDLRQWQARGTDALAIPHHIGYKRGYRGINWDDFKPEFSPVVEIMSMHGASESPEAPYPYLHTMGPRDWRSMFHYGLTQGHVVGCIGSTDHHSAHPGSYGHGRMGVWSESLTRNSIWEAIKARRTYTLTGDKIALAFAINGGLMGSIQPGNEKRHIQCKVRGGGAIDYVEILHNNCVIHRSSTIQHTQDESVRHKGPYKIYLEMGWGKKGENYDWQVELEVADGELLDAEPRFRGHDVVAPQATEEDSYAFSGWEREGRSKIQFHTRTYGNPATTTPGTQGFCLEIAGDARTMIRSLINDQKVEVSISDLLAGPKTGYIGGFLTPAYCFHRAVPEWEYTSRMEFVHQVESHNRDWYTVRVRQYNGQWAWSSPIWVEPI